METIGFGMIGAGAISGAHLPPIAEREDTRLVCVADLNLDRAKEKAAAFGAERAVTDYNELIAMDDIQAVVVGIPSGLHADATIKAAQAGKHVLCEKPMARTLEECDAMTQAAADAGVVLQIGFIRRFCPDWGMFRRLIHQGRAGRPCVVRRLSAGAGAGPPKYGEWYMDDRFSDGPLTEKAIHDIDFDRYIFGDAKSVQATTWHMGKRGDVQDTAFVTIEFQSADRVLLAISWGMAAKGAQGMVGGIDAFGPEGSIAFPPSMSAEKKCFAVTDAEGNEEQVPYDADLLTVVRSHAQMDNFIQSIRGTATPLATAEDGRKAQEIALAAFESSRTGRRVELG